MSHRERQTPGGSAAAAPRPPEPRPRDPAAPVPHWEALYPTLAAVQQQTLLALARRQGFLTADQLPAAPAPAADQARQIFNRLLQGHDAAQPEPVQYAPLDRELDAGQQVAVARALATPDLCLIRGGPGTGKCRVAVELIRQVVLRGQRILLVSPTADGLDHLLGRLTAHHEVLALRCLARGERWETLPEAVRGLTLPGQQTHLRTEALPHARRTIAAAEERLRRAAQDEPLFEQLAEVAVQAEAAAREVAAAETGLRDLPPTVGPIPEAWVAAATAADTDLARAVGEVEAGSRQTLAKLTATEQGAESELARLTEAIKEAQAQLDALRPLADARQSGRWWNATYWRAVCSGDVQARCAEWDNRRREAEQGLEQARNRVAELARERERLETECRSQREGLLRQFLETERTERTERLAALRRAEDRWAGVWDELCGRAVSGIRPARRSCDAVAAARRELAEMVTAAQQELVLSRPWAEWLEDHAERLPARLAEAANVVAATPAALGDELLAEAARHGGFDLLLVPHAEQLAEPDFDQAARRARRWVLIGTEPPFAETEEPRGDGRNGRSGGQRGRPAVPLFTRLWEALHADVWTVADGRLTCCLRAVPVQQRHRLETETLADRPEVELRIWTPPAADPVLAEVSFPDGWGLVDALPFLFGELGELPLPTGPAGRWNEGDGALTFAFLDGPGQRLRIDLDGGVSAEVLELPAGPAPWHAAALVFDPGAGWTRPKAEEWLRERVRHPDSGRTARLTVNHRQAPALVSVIGHLCHGGPCPADGSALEFIPVPALGANGRGHSGWRGAGLETDLSDPRQRERLPRELSDVLPPHGLVDLPEAQAVARLLETWPAHDRPMSLAVLALYPAQAELLRRLLGRSVTVATPETLRHREFDTVVVSLTRSHGHRAVPFGPQPLGLWEALARATRRVVLVGDPGTLARRGQWDGPVDHLSPAAARWERGWVSALCEMQFGPREGSRS